MGSIEQVLPDSFQLNHACTNCKRTVFTNVIYFPIFFSGGQIFLICIIWGRFPLTGFPHLLENLEKWEYTWKTWKNHGILQKIIKIMEKLHGTWKNIWVDYKSVHARGRPQVVCVCLLSGGWNKCSILCMHWNGPRVRATNTIRDAYGKICETKGTWKTGLSIQDFTVWCLTVRASCSIKGYRCWICCKSFDW